MAIDKEAAEKIVKEIEGKEPEAVIEFYTQDNGNMGMALRFKDDPQTYGDLTETQKAAHLAAALFAQTFGGQPVHNDGEVTDYDGAAADELEEIRKLSGLH